MGSGASAGVAAQIKVEDATADQLGVAGLSDEERAKMVAPVDGGSTPAASDGKADKPAPWRLDGDNAIDFAAVEKNPESKQKLAELLAGTTDGGYRHEVIETLNQEHYKDTPKGFKFSLPDVNGAPASYSLVCCSNGPTIVSIRRNLVDTNFTPLLTKEERVEMTEIVVRPRLQNLADELKGEYIPLDQITNEQKEELEGLGLLFSKKSSSKESDDDWVVGRGIFVNAAKNFIVWVGEEDHLRIISTGNKSGEVCNRLAKAVDILCREGLKFQHDEDFGFLTVNPCNAGHAVDVAIQLPLPNLAKDETSFKALCDKNNIQAQKIDGALYQLSNIRKRFDVNVTQCLSAFDTSVKAILAAEAQG